MITFFSFCGIGAVLCGYAYGTYESEVDESVDHDKTLTFLFSSLDNEVFFEGKLMPVEQALLSKGGNTLLHGHILVEPEEAFPEGYFETQGVCMFMYVCVDGCEKVIYV